MPEGPGEGAGEPVQKTAKQLEKEAKKAAEKAAKLDKFKAKQEVKVRTVLRQNVASHNVYVTEHNITKCKSF